MDKINMTKPRLLKTYSKPSVKWIYIRLVSQHSSQNYAQNAYLRVIDGIGVIDNANEKIDQSAQTCVKAEGPKLALRGI